MTDRIKKPLPCNVYDFRGLERWLDEMALQGLFFDGISYHSDRAFFLPGEPKAVRYRLDPVGKKWNDVERKELYAQAGWKFEDAIPRLFYIFSCDDPDIPELHSDPQAMAYALRRTVRSARRTLWLIPAMLAAMLLLLLAYPGPQALLSTVILMENPRYPWFLLLFSLLMAAGLLQSFREFRRLKADQRALDLGLSPSPRRRWDHPGFWLVYLLVFLPLWGIHSWAGSYLPPLYTLDELSLSLPWPTAAQLDATGPVPEDDWVTLQGWGKVNSSLLAPVQEETEQSMDFRGSPEFRSLLTTRYVRARSDGLARVLCRSLAYQEWKDLQRQEKFNYRYDFQQVTEVGGLQIMEHPVFDHLEVARFWRGGREGFLLAGRRGTQLLVAEYSGPGRLEACLSLYAELLSPGAEEVNP